ncbi:MAG: hypothetical protein AAGF12_35365 [Myxococcota bacterium]
MKGPSPLLGYNTNVRHKGKLYHIQTEDSGVKHPHIITHLFADGGRIIASRKTSYAEHVGAQDLRAVVKKLMQEQHKGMFIALRDGVYDEDAPPKEEVAEEISVDIDVDALEAAAARLATSVPPPVSSGRYQTTQPAEVAGATTVKPSESIFGGDLLSEKSLDEVILSYLAEDLENEETPG